MENEDIRKEVVRIAEDYPEYIILASNYSKGKVIIHHKGR